MIKAKTPTAPAKKKGASASAGLPPGFSHLEHWIAAWVLPDAQARTDKRQTTPYPEIKNFYDEMLAAAPSALDYLRQCTLGKLDATSTRLLKLMLALAEIGPAVEWYRQAAVIDGYDPQKFKLTGQLSDTAAQEGHV